ncbi:MAG: response regulator [Deltaproteobacteria bacterium]|nr:response regulator [Deltaproteobacteria bacterium]
MKEKILIIDREPDIRYAIERLLSKEGYQVRNVPESKEAIHIFKSEPFDLVIMDINMPEANGLQVMRDIKKLKKTIEVIVLTGLNSVMQSLEHDGAFDFLGKPLENHDQLINSVEKALQKQKWHKTQGCLSGD